jgi:hypothetical protein
VYPRWVPTTMRWNLLSNHAIENTSANGFTK